MGDWAHEHWGVHLRHHRSLGQDQGLRAKQGWGSKRALDENSTSGFLGLVKGCRVLLHGCQLGDILCLMVLHLQLSLHHEDSHRVTEHKNENRGLV